MSDPFLGEIRIVAFPFAPRGYALCQGQRVPIAQHGALFSLLGTYYGGDGETEFALPDLRGRVPMGAGAPAGPRLGEHSDHALPAAPEGGAVLPGALGLNFVIAMQGRLPPRGA